MTQPRTISSMSEADIAEVAAVERLCHDQPWSTDLFRQELANPLAAVDLLRIDGELAGFLCSWWIFGELEIHNVATAPDFRRRGVARELLRHVFTRSRARGLERVFLEVREGNRGAIALYRSFGFRDLDRRRHYYADGEDALIMEWRPDAAARNPQQENSLDEEL